VVDEIKAKGGEAIASTALDSRPKNADEIVKAALSAFAASISGQQTPDPWRRIFMHSGRTGRTWLASEPHGAFKHERACAAQSASRNSGAFVHMTSTSAPLVGGNFGRAKLHGGQVRHRSGSRAAIALDIAALKVATRNCH